MLRPYDPDYSEIEDELLRARVKSALFQLPPLRIGHFSLRRLLGRGAHGSVYEAEDASAQRIVALKLLRRDDASAVRCFKQEFRRLANVVHENLVQLHELASQEGRWYFTMELIDGVTFTRYVDRSRSIDAKGDEQVRAALSGLLLGVQAIHSSGHIHGDLKPSNVLVGENARAVVLDFGLVSSAAMNRARLAPDEAVPGTPRYMAPEVRLHGHRTAAGDAFAIGVMLFDVFSARSSARSAPTPESAQSIVDPDVSADLLSICTGFLEPDPARRLTIGAALATLGYDVAGSTSSLAQLRTPAFVGRKTELAALQAAFESLQGEPRVTLVSGPSGIGKSALCDRFAEGLRGRATILRGRCYERESLPYKAFDGLIDELVRHLATLPSHMFSELKLSSHHALRRLFPSFDMAVRWSATERPSDVVQSQSELRQLAFAELKDLFVKLAALGPLVLIVDDLQWADLDSARLLAELLGPPAAPGLLYVGCYREGERATSEFLSELWLDDGTTRLQCTVEHLSLERLGISDAVEMARLLLASDGQTESVRERIARESGGSPFFIRELADHFARDPDRDGTSLSLTQLLMRRLAGLTSTARFVVSVLALASRPLFDGLLARLVSDLATRERALRSLALAGVVRRTANGAWVIYHDVLRECVGGLMSAEDGVVLHRLLAESYEATSSGEPEWLIEHWLGAKERARALDYAVAAARRAVHKLAFNRAAALFRIAVDLCEDGDPRTRELSPELAGTLAHAGRSAEAASAFLEAVRHVDPQDAAAMRCLAVQQYLRSGRSAEAGKLLRELLLEAGVQYATTDFGLYCGIVASRVRLACKTAVSKLRRARFDPLAQRRLLIFRSAFRETSALDPLRGALLQSLFCEQAQQCRDAEAQFLGLAWDTYAASFVGGIRVAAATARRIRRLETMIQHVDSAYSKATLDLVRAAAALYECRHLEVETPSHRAARAFREQCAGASWEASICDLLRYTAMEVAGPISTLCADAPVLQRRAAEHADQFSEAVLSRIISQALLAQDEPDRALDFLRGRLQDLEMAAGDSFDIRRWLINQNLVDCLSYAGDHRGAWELLEAEWKTYTRSFLAKAQYVQSASHYRRGRAAVAYNLVRGDPELMKVIAVEAKLLTRLRRHDSTAAAELCRAALATQRGELSETRRHLRLAEIAARSAGTTIPAALAKRQCGRLCSGAEGERMIYEADEALRAQGIANPARWADTFAPAIGPHR